MLYRKILEEYHSLQSQIKQIQEKLENMPEGKLLFSRNGSNVKWYVSDGHKKVYIPKKNRQFAEQLAAKKYLTMKLEALQREKKALKSYLWHHSERPDMSEQLLAADSEYHELLSPYFKLRNEGLEQWAKEPYNQNVKYPENLIHKTSSGILVRSKSEAMIELFLHSNHIPFRYECALEIENVILYPDFTILHPETGKIYYWEHFGLMDDPGYVKNVCSKLQIYASGGIIPSIQLITTYETKEYPFGYKDAVAAGSPFFL